MTQDSFELENQHELGYGELLSVFWRRRFWFLGTVCGVLGIAIAVTFLKQPIYESSMELLVESNYENKQENQGSLETNFTDSNFNLDYATQQNLMHSSGLLQKAVERLQKEYPELTTEDLQEYLSINQVRNKVDNHLIDTKIFQVDYYSDDPVKTQRVLEEIKQVYQEYNLEQQEKRLKEGLSFINKQLPQARQNLLQAETALKQFRLRNNLIGPEEEMEAVAQALREIQKERDSLQAEVRQTKGSYQQLGKQLGFSGNQALNSSRLSESARYQNLLNAIQETELQLKQERTKFSDSHPVIQNLLEQLNNQETLLQQEVERVLGTIPPELEITVEALEKEGQLGQSDLNLAQSLREAETILESLEQKDLSLADTEKRLKQELSRFPSLIDEYNNLSQEVEIKRNTLQKLLEAKQELGIEINRGGFNWQVVEPPQLGEQIAPNHLKDILLGGVAAIFLGGITCFARETLDKKLYSTEQLKGQLSFPLLGTAPGLSLSDNQQFMVNLPFLSLPEAYVSILHLLEWQPFRDSLDLVYENIQLLNSGLALNSIAVTSAIAGEGKTTVVLGLALSAARRHKTVLVIDANLRRPSLHLHLDLANEKGLSSLLTGETNKPLLKRVSLLNTSIDVLTAGTVPTDPIRLLSSPQLEKLIAKFEEIYDLVIIDAPSTLGMVDAIQTASYCSGTVMVVRLDRVTSSELTEATALLSKLNVLGVVANGSKETRYGGQNPYLLTGTTS